MHGKGGLSTFRKYGKNSYRIGSKTNKAQREMNLILCDFGNAREEYSQLLQKVLGSDRNKETKRR